MSTADVTVLIAGASGDTGQELLAVLRPTDLRVRATTRSYAAVDELERQGADEVMVVDLFDSADVVRAVEGCDMVFSTVGSPAGLGHVLGGKLVDRTGVINLVTASVAEGVGHFVLQSAIGVGSSRSRLPLPGRLLLRGSLRAKRDAETALRRSGIPFTIVRPGRLTDEPPTGEIVTGEGGDSVWGTIPRSDVARVLAAAPFTAEAQNRTLEVVSRSGLDGRPKHFVDVPWSFERVGIEGERVTRASSGGESSPNP